jgi:aryl-alcohol dehydrogenase-like predicted oxidoreductase
MPSMKRTLGKSGIEVSALGMGCWAIGGPYNWNGQAVGWGQVDDAESERAIHHALELGVNFFDTAGSYGAGHSERVLGHALRGARDRVVIATKFGLTFNEEQREMTGVNLALTHADVRTECEGSLRRLETDYIDVFLLHPGEYSLQDAPEVVNALEALVKDGLIRNYGWSTDDPEGAKVFAQGEHCAIVEHQLNIFEDNPAMLEVCHTLKLGSINRGPLAMGLLTGKFRAGQSLPKDDIRGVGPEWMQYFRNGQPNPEWMARLEAIRAILTSSGRTLEQGALAWLWARSPNTIPIPGFRTARQVQENAGALEFGPLEPAQMQEIQVILGTPVQ